MDSFFIEFRDPLFGIIVFFVLVFVITFLSYWWGRYKYQESSKDLDNFLKGFNSLPSQDELNIFIGKGELSKQSWLMLANTYVNNGDYEKSIDIYRELLKNSDLTASRNIMLILGKTYLKAGFLERAKQIFLEILKNTPRTVEALEQLLLVYEQLREYKLAFDVLESLEELQENTLTNSSYFQVLEVMNDSKKTVEIKTKELVKIYKQNNILIYMIFEFLFRTDSKLAWENLDTSKSELLIDILWGIDKKDLDFDIISNSEFLTQLYSARGDFDRVQESSNFELNLLINLKNSIHATLSFEYICTSCQQSYPFAFNRCNHCHTIDTQSIEYRVVKDYYRDFNEENNSFQ